MFGYVDTFGDDLEMMSSLSKTDLLVGVSHPF